MSEIKLNELEKTILNFFNSNEKDKLLKELELINLHIHNGTQNYKDLERKKKIERRLTEIEFEKKNG